MPKKIFELAKDFDIGALDLVEKLRNQGFSVRNHMSSLSDEDVVKIEEMFRKEVDKESAKKKAAVKKAQKSSAKPKVEEAEKSEVKSSGPENENKIVTVKRKAPAIVLRKAEEAKIEAPSLENEVSYEADSMARSSSPEENEEAVGLEGQAPQEFSEVAEKTIREIPEGSGEQRTQGLRVVYRPPLETEKPVVQEKENKVHGQGTQQATVTTTGKAAEPAAPQKPEPVAPKRSNLYEEKMHSFTPIYIPPVVPKDPKAGPDTKIRDQRTHAEIDADKTMTEAEKKEAKKARPAKFKEFADEERLYVKKTPELEVEDENSPKKRMGGLAQVVTRVAKSKGKEVVQIRADEELKSYATGVIGKVVYTPVGKKKIYNGPSKGTRLTEVKDAKRVVNVHEGSRAGDLAQKLHVKFTELRDQCLDLNLLVQENDYFGMHLLAEVAALFKYRVEDRSFDEESYLSTSEERQGEHFPVRPPVVTVMGHVDHGKTTLLDSIRKCTVVKDEAGGITQHIGAYSVKTEHGAITFIDTPGHAAFGAMRERGAKLTDIVILVVAADDGVMPQTKESIRYCQSNGVPIIVAVNKIDKENKNTERIKQELMEFHLTPEEWGGETQYVEVSALKGTGLDKLVESITLQAEIMDLRANNEGKAHGVVIESRLEPGRGVLTTILVQNGVLKKGECLVAGEMSGKCKVFTDSFGQPLDFVGPGTPAVMLGFSDFPIPGDEFDVVNTEKEAKKIAQNRIDRRKEIENAPVKKVSLEDFFGLESETGTQKSLKLIVRSDVSGSLQAIKNALGSMGNSEVTVDIIGGGIGPITDSDVNFAKSAGAYIIGFGVSASTSARRSAEDNGVDMKTYRIIYELIQSVKDALEGMLTPDKVERYIGRAEVRDVFSIPKVGIIAGSAVIDGKIERGCFVRLLRDGKIIHDGKVSSLKRFKDDVKEVKTGFECGIFLQDFNKVDVKDILEAYMIDEVKRKLEDGPLL